MKILIDILSRHATRMADLFSRTPHRRGRRAVRAAAALLPLACFMLYASCDESLPPRDEPQKFFTPTVSAGYTNLRGMEGIYLTVKVQNTYTETFSQAADIFGFVTIQWKDRPGFQRRFELTAADYRQFYLDPSTGLSIATKSSYNATTKSLTIPENEYAVFQIRWDLVFNDTIDLRTQVPYHPDPVNPHIGYTDDLTFAVTAGVHLYKNIPMLYPEVLKYKQRLSRPQ